MVVLGDSLNDELAQVLWSIWGVTETKRGADYPRDGSICLTGRGVGGAASDSVYMGPPSLLTGIRNDRLDTHTTAFAWDKGNNFMWYPWVQEVAATLADGRPQYSFFLLNKGAHYVGDAEYVRELRETLSWLRTHVPAAALFYRSTPPGHPDCVVSTRPLTRDSTPAERAALPFHWGDFARQNDLARGVIAAEFPGVVFLDVAPATALRQDSHVGGHDCLHYCNPGPLDFWVTLWYNALALLDEGKQVGKP